MMSTRCILSIEYCSLFSRNKLWIRKTIVLLDLKLQEKYCRKEEHLISLKEDFQIYH